MCTERPDITQRDNSRGDVPFLLHHCNHSWYLMPWLGPLKEWGREEYKGCIALCDWCFFRKEKNKEGYRGYTARF